MMSMKRPGVKPAAAMNRPAAMASGSAKGKMPAMKGKMPAMKKGGKVGGSYRKAADGVASKGKTKAKMVAMRMGGKC